MITVNIATGTPEEAVEWLQYINRPDKTGYQPPKVKYWEIGNENYFYGDAPYLKKGALNGKQYANRALKYASISMVETSAQCRSSINNTSGRLREASIKKEASSRLSCSCVVLRTDSRNC